MKLINAVTGQEITLNTPGKLQAANEMFAACKLGYNFQNTFYAQSPMEFCQFLALSGHLDISSDPNHPDYEFSNKIACSMLDQLLEG